eukprot:COSAG04_NODE_1677_length_5966_cov_9.922618_2_plen_87_part_00
MKNTAPSLVSMPTLSLQTLKSMPMLESAPDWSAGPSMPIVTKESNSATALNEIKAALVGPKSEPNGAGTWKAGGKRIDVSGVPAIA